MTDENGIPDARREEVLVNVVGLLVEVAGALTAIVGDLRARTYPDYDDRLPGIEKDPRLRARAAARDLAFGVASARTRGISPRPAIYFAKPS